MKEGLKRINKNGELVPKVTFSPDLRPENCNGFLDQERIEFERAKRGEEVVLFKAVKAKI